MTLEQKLNAVIKDSYAQNRLTELLILENLVIKSFSFASHVVISKFPLLPANIFTVAALFSMRHPSE